MNKETDRGIKYYATKKFTIEKIVKEREARQRMYRKMKDSDKNID